MTFEKQNHFSMAYLESVTMSNSRIVTAPDAAGKCNVRGCHVKGAQTVPCASDKCEKRVHVICYQDIVLEDKNGLPMWPHYPTTLSVAPKLATSTTQ
jgi:hypothetical protein